MGRKYSIGSFPLTSYLSTPTLYYRSSGSRSSLDISFVPFSLALSYSWELLQHLGSDHLPILVTVLFLCALSPQPTSPFFNFQKVLWDDFAFYFDSHRPSATKYSSVSLSSSATLFTSLALSAVKFPIPFGHVKCQLQAWWSPEVEEAAIERRKTFAGAHRSDEDCQAYISASRHVLSVIAKVKIEAWQATCSYLCLLNLTLNLCILFFVLSPALHSLLLICPTVPFPGSRLWSLPTT